MSCARTFCPSTISACSVRSPSISIMANASRAPRWTDAQIPEGPAFGSELAEREIPVVAPMTLGGESTLAAFGGFRFAIYPRPGGRAPELEDRSTLEWLGRFLGRIHAIGRIEAFRERPALDVASFGEEPREYLLAHDFVPTDLLPAWTSTIAQALDGIRRSFDRAGSVGTIRLHGDCHAGNILWTAAGPHFVDFDDC